MGILVYMGVDRWGLRGLKPTPPQTQNKLCCEIDERLQTYSVAGISNLSKQINS